MFTDSSWASNKDYRKSVTGFVIMLEETPIMWRSQAQKSVALSSTEAEYYATSEAAKEIKFVIQVLESMKLQIEKPVIVHIDNVGAIFVAENASATKHTRHIDARYHFVREYIIEGVIKIIFVKSQENKADIFTKNVSSEIYEEHIDNFVIHREVIKVTDEELNDIGKFGSEGVLEIPDSNRTGFSNIENRSLSPTTGSSQSDAVTGYLCGTYTPRNKNVVRIHRSDPRTTKTTTQVVTKGPTVSLKDKK
jgi:hypothetical protein